MDRPRREKKTQVMKIRDFLLPGAIVASSTFSQIKNKNVDKVATERSGERLRRHHGTAKRLQLFSETHQGTDSIILHLEHGTELSLEVGQICFTIFLNAMRHLKNRAVVEIHRSGICLDLMLST